MTSAETIEKIKKLLRLARSSNIHEAQLALARAMALAQEHAVAIEGLDPDEQAKEKKVTHRETEPEGCISYDKRFAFGLCRTFFHVDTVTIRCIRTVNGWPRYGYKTAIIGTNSDIEIALYVFGFLTHHFSFCWRKYRGRLRNRYAFVEGMFSGIYDRLTLDAPLSTGTELAVTDRENYIEAVIGKTKKSKHQGPDHDATAAKNAGYLHGRNTQIPGGLKAPETGVLTLTA